MDTGNGTVTAGSLRTGGYVLGNIGATGPSASTSQHVLDTAGSKIWGSGATGAAGATTTLECTSCHDPHGNGNFRILKPIPDGGAAFLPATVAVTSLTNTGFAPGSTTNYLYDVVTPTNTFKATQPVTFYGLSGSPAVISGSSISAVVSATEFQFTSSTNYTTTSGGFVAYANPLGIQGAASNGTKYTYTTLSGHGLAIGTVVTITGVSNSAFNLVKAAITAVPSTTTFEVTPTTPVANLTTGTGGTYSGGGSTGGIPDAQLKVYTTTNYWAADDHNYTGANVALYTTNSTTQTAANGGPSAFITNVSQWCSECHTRLLAGSGSYKTNSGDAMYTFEHRSNNGKEGSPNCIQCHVAHGSNASMGGDGKTTYASTVTNPDGTAGDSFLLRVDNRGTCNMCHNK